MSALAPSDLDRLGKLLGMLGSAHDGERAAAGMKATEFLRGRNVTWAQLVERLKDAHAAPPEGGRPSGRGRDKPSPAGAHDHRRLAAMCLAMGANLNEWELAFLHSIRNRIKPLSAKQWAKLRQIEEKIDAATSASDSRETA